jgi:hypothetical protein
VSKFGSKPSTPDDEGTGSVADSPADSATSKKTAVEELERKAEIDVKLRIMATMGAPPDFCRVEAHHVGINRFRVNVFTAMAGPEMIGVKNMRIAHSFFVQTSTTGAIIRTTPALKRLYNVERE